jgi:3-hydroxybutyryl-CoA dehydrogenase
LKFDLVKNVAITGSGTMGTGIGMCFAQAGYGVKLYDINSEALEAALKRMRNSQDVLIKEGVISEAAAQKARGKIKVTTQLKEALDEVEYVLEAIPEILNLKKSLFKEMESLCPPDTILATNTSGLSITSIASACRHPERVGGMHWVNPPELVPLVEVIRGDKTSEDTLVLIYEIAKKLGKIPIMVKKDVAGFAMNRLQYAALREAMHLVEAGVVSPEDVDRAMKYGAGFRYPWLGPLETADLGGLDVFYNVAGYLFKDLSNMDKAPDSFSKLIENGKLGIKTGQGFYHYEAGSREEILRKRDLYFVRQWKLIQETKGNS